MTTGTVEATSEAVAAAELREQGLWVTDLRTTQGGGRVAHPAARSAPTERPGYHGAPRGSGTARETDIAKRIHSPVSLKDLAVFYRQLYTLLNSGVGIFQALEMLCDPNQCANAELRRVVQILSQHLLAGRSLSQGMSQFPWLFDRMQIRMVEAGEAGGLLVTVLMRLAEYLEREYETRSEIKRKTLYPKLVVGLLMFVLPINVPLTLGGYLHDLMFILLWVGGLGLFFWLFGRTFFTSQAGRELLDQIWLSVPVIGPLVRKMAVARFGRTLSALYGAGVPISAALGMAGEACGNTVLEKHSRVMVPALERGGSIAGVLQASGFFPGMFSGMVSTGETSGNLDDTLSKAAEFYEQEASHATTQLVVIMGVMLLVFVAIMVGVKLVSFYSGMYSGIGGMGGGGAGGGE